MLAAELDGLDSGSGIVLLVSKLPKIHVKIVNQAQWRRAKAGEAHGAFRIRWNGAIRIGAPFLDRYFFGADSALAFRLDAIDRGLIERART